MSDTLTLASRSTDVADARTCGAVELLGRSSAILRVQELLRRAATTEGGVLFVAEPGSDVISIARDLHHLGSSPSSAFVAIDCAIDAIRLDSLLFGTLSNGSSASELEPIGAASRVAAARGGVLFLQNVGDLPASAQARLARVVRDGEALIDGEPVPLSLRLMAGAAPWIDSEVRNRGFRNDLFRRLSSCRIDLPPMRDRAADVPAVAARLLEQACHDSELPVHAFSQAALALLSALSWPGNLAEIQAVVNQVVADIPRDLVEPGGLIQIENLLPALKLDCAPGRFVPTGNLREARLRFERDYIAAVLQHHDWRMAAAAHTLGIQRPNLYRKARQLGITLTRVTE
jgi:DNA-binding NtrC family response regulator